MAENTGIEWARHTWSPWLGCAKVGPACDHCYAEAWAKRTGRPELWQGERRQTSLAYWHRPIVWNRAAAETGERPRVFPSLCDPFDNAVPAAWRQGWFELIRETPNLDWLLLTKRIGNAPKMLPADWGDGWPNVAIGATVVTEPEALRDVPKLRDVACAMRFLSMEPLLEDVALAGEWLTGDRRIDWIIAGGESGPHARPSHPDWFRRLRDQCAWAGTAFFFKQWGEWAPWAPGAGNAKIIYLSAKDGKSFSSPCGIGDPQGPRADTRAMACVGKKAAGALLDGREHREFPEWRRAA